MTIQKVNNINDKNIGFSLMSSPGSKYTNLVKPKEIFNIRYMKETIDCYTVVLKKKYSNFNPREPRNRDALGISEGGRSFSQWSECIPGRHLGKVIAWDELSKETQQHIITKINTE